MTATLLGFVATCITVVGIVAIGLTDPKRARRRAERLSKVVRYAGFALALGPGLLLVLKAHAVAALIWIGASAIGGWAVTNALNIGKTR